MSDHPQYTAHLVGGPGDKSTITLRVATPRVLIPGEDGAYHKTLTKSGGPLSDADLTYAWHPEPTGVGEGRADTP
jgi:hypothetical protein